MTQAVQSTDMDISGCRAKSRTLNGQTALPRMSEPTGLKTNRSVQRAIPKGELSVLPQLRQRTQAGHTNRMKFYPGLGSDLLGQAQVQRARRASIGTSFRAIRTAASPPPHPEHSQTPPPLDRLLPHVESTTPAGDPQPSVPPVHTQTPEELFYLVSQQVVPKNLPDIVLECLDSQWELHSSHLHQSRVLFDLYVAARQQRARQQKDRAGSARSKAPPSGSTVGCRDKQSRGGNLTGPVVLHLPVKDPSVTTDGLSFALRTLYSGGWRPPAWGEGLLAAAALLGLTPLFQRCLSEMIQGICYSTVCEFHRVACKYREVGLQRACERWLELYLVTELSCSIHLRNLPLDLLHTTLRSPRVYAGSEYQLMKTALYWVFLQFNPACQIFPSHRTILNFFYNWPKAGKFLEHPQGQRFQILFQSLRLHGITMRSQLEEMEKIQVFPQSWLLCIFSRHYYTIHSGGDMLMRNFSQQAVRFGMVIERDPQYSTQTVDLYGVYFLLKASAGGRDTHCFSLQRLRRSDPAMPVKLSQRHPFSLMSARFVTYQIRVQAQEAGQWTEHTTGPVSHTFGVQKGNSKSQVFTVKNLSLPIFVTFALAFPAA